MQISPDARSAFAGTRAAIVLFLGTMIGLAIIEWGCLQRGRTSEGLWV